MNFEELDIYEIVHGLFLTLDNAKSLIEDAQLLFSNNRIARTFVLSQLANEEIGKAFILYNLYMSLKIEGEKIEYKKIKKDFFDHKSKTFEATMADFLIGCNKIRTLKKSTKLKIADKILTEIKKGENEYNDLKNKGLYVSFLQNKFVSPNGSISIEDAKSALLKAKDRLNVTFLMAKREVDFDLENGTHPKFYTSL